MKVRKLIALFLVVAILSSSAVFAAEGEKSVLLQGNSAAENNTGIPFSDVEAGKWYTDAVMYVNDKNLMTGTGPKAFNPMAEMSRAQFVTVLWRMDGEETVSGEIPYTDVKSGLWYTEAIRWATEKDIVDGYSETVFEPDQTLTREQFSVILYRYQKAESLNTGINTDFDLDFADAGKISSWAYEAVCWMAENRIIQGTDQNLIVPQGNVTRAQAAVMIQRFLENPDDRSPLSLWTRNAEARSALISYIDRITDKNSPDYIPDEDRIAVFDLDGTLFCETDPNYFDYTLLKYRVLEDPDYVDKASEFEREVANKIKEQNEKGTSFSGLETDHGKAVASAFAGMTIAEFNSYIQNFKKQSMPSYTGMTRGESFYQPMVQVVNYLQANNFTVYVVSGTDRLIVRGILDNSVLNIPNRQIIGSDETIIASNQGETDGLDYVFSDGEELILGGDFLIKNLKMNKVSVIMQEIGQQPVLSFGNSTGDSSMAEYVTSGNPYLSLAFMLCCDDTDRENGNQAKADKMASLCEEYDWIPISMKNDWTTIYGDGVIYNGGQNDE